MSFLNCILGHVKNGKLSEASAKALETEFDDLVKKYEKTMGNTAAAQAAAQRIVSTKTNILLKKSENEIYHAIYQRSIRQELEGAAAANQAEIDKAPAALKGLFANPYAKAIRDKLENVYDRTFSVERELFMTIADALEKYRSKAGGFVQNTEDFLLVVSEILGKNSGRADITAAAKAIDAAFIKARNLYEENGGILGKIDNYFPVHHEQVLVARSSYEDWSNFIKPLLDREKMIDLDTGLPIDGKRLDEALKASYDNIVSNGLVDVGRAAQAGKQKLPLSGELNMRRTNSRFFHFKDADSFLAYNEKFGRGTEGLFDAMVGHLSSMARDIGIMQKLGPKPTAIMRNIDLEMQARDFGVVSKRTINGMYDTLSGKSSWGGKQGLFYRFNMGWLNLKRSAVLGSAPISAVSDSYYVSLAAKMNGLPALKTMKNYVKLLNPADATDRAVARNLFYVASAVNGANLKAARFSDDIGGRGGITSWFAGLTNRVSGLAAMTDAGRMAIMQTHGAMMAHYKQRGIGWVDLEPDVRAAASRYGITSDDWASIMNSSVTNHPDMPDAQWLLPENVMEINQWAARKYGDWMVAVGTLAVNEPRLLTRTITSGAFLGEAPQGSLLRLMAANTFFTKSFGITVILNHLLPSLRKASQGRFEHLAAVVAGGTVFGALALQLRAVITGKTPEDTDKPEFWIRASMQGGGFGLMGDFLLADYSRLGQTIGGTVAGPVVGTVQSLLKAGNLYGLAGDDWDASAFAAETFRIASREVPLINLWYSRLAVERGILDQVSKAIDPKFNTRLRRMESKMQKEQGQEFWWRKGELLPEIAQ